MSTCHTAIRLVNSLSASEKRHFRIATNKQTGDKCYLTLFDIINNCSTTETSLKKITDEFKKKLPNATIETTAKYLIKIITDRLIAAKTEKDNEFHLFQSILRIKILQERSLQKEAYSELKKISRKATDTQQHMIKYILLRMEQNYLSNQNFPETTDKLLVDMQMKSKETLRIIHNIEAHSSLYGLIKHRINQTGRIISHEDKKKVNDLLLSELSIVAGKVKNSFESKKIHLLFQSLYFAHIADHKSALKSFHELNKLFEQHPDLREHPPLDYFSALDGILDSLRIVGKYEEMKLYIDKLQQLANTVPPEYFKFLVEKTITIYTLATLIGENKITAAGTFVESVHPLVFSAYQLIHIEKQTELIFYQSLTYFEMKEYKKAHKLIQPGLTDNRKQIPKPIHRAIRLLNIIIYYELKHIDFLQYEIRSYTRYFIIKRNLTKCEKLIFKTIQLHPYANGFIKNKLYAKKIAGNIAAIRADKYEEHLTKYMDWCKWAQSKFEKQ